MKFYSANELRARSRAEYLIREKAKKTKSGASNYEGLRQEVQSKKATEKVPHKPKRRGRPSKVVSQQVVAISDDDLEPEDEEVTPQARDLEPEEILEALKKAAASLSTLWSCEDVEKFLKRHGFKDQEDLKELQQHCSLIDKLLRAKLASPPNKVVATKKDHGVLEALIQNQYFIFRGPGQVVMILAPVEIFQGKVNLQTKTIGFVVDRSGLIDRIAVSGWGESVEDHEKILDAKKYTKHAMVFSLDQDLEIRSGPFESGHKMPPGSEFLSHVEKQVMMYWALELLKRFYGTDRVGMLSQLRSIKSPDKKVDIYIAGVSDMVCTCCRTFQKRIEEVTGMEFTIHIIPNLAKLEAKKGKKRKFFDIPSMGLAEPTRLEVVIRNRVSQKPATSLTTQTTVVSKLVQDRNIQKASSQAATPRKRRAVWEEDDSGSEYELPSSSTTIEMYTPERRWTRTVMTPDSSPDGMSKKGKKKVPIRARRMGWD